MILGLISDTHGHVDPRLASLFSGVDHILHAGDVGDRRVVRELEEIAPVTVVSGNTDFHPEWEMTVVVRLGACKWVLQHIVDPAHPAEALRLLLARERPEAVVFGHTHQTCHELRDGVLYVNPGYAGIPRGQAKRSVALARCTGGGVEVEFHGL